MKRLLLLFGLSAAAAFAQTPAITQILNNYGLNNPGTVAQGAIFIVKGTNLSDQTTGLQNVTLQTTLQGVQMKITVGGTTTLAPLYYVLPAQLAGILPSNTPTGTGTLVVVNNGKTSAPAAITVIKSGFGALTLSGAGSGPAGVHDATYTLLANSNATNPGNAVVFYGSGLGPTPANETVEQSGVNASGDLASIPITVQIGGKTAQVLYHGRTAFPGLDQINIVIPTLDTNTYSCTVTVSITTNNVPANVVTIPVAASGTTCSNPNTGGGGNTSINPTASETSAWAAAGTYKEGNVGLLRTKGTTIRDLASGSTTVTSTLNTVLSGSWQKLSGPDVSRSLLNPNLAPYIPTAGTCAVITNTFVNPIPNITITYLDGGPSFSSTGPPGTQSAPKVQQGAIIQYSGGIIASPANYMVEGRYTFSGPGGPDVGSFSGNLDVAPELVFTNSDSIKTVPRNAPLTVSWTGGDPTSLVTVGGQSVVTATNFAQFFCWANNSDGHLAVPANILNQLPASPVSNAGGFTQVTRGRLTMYSTSSTRLNAPGIDLFTATAEWLTDIAVQYQ